jgi:hypothetical protein
MGVAGTPRRVEAAIEQMAMRLIADFEPATGYEVIGFTIHTDTADPHVNVVLAKVRKDSSGVFRLIGKRGLGLAGPWMVGVDRQRSAGIVYAPHDKKYERALTRFRDRLPGRDLPLDIRLARKLDSIAEQVIGALRVFRDAYRDRVERKRDRAIEGRREELIAELKQLAPLGRSDPASNRDKSYGHN